jgi:pimeloyl-ACP methyl ester carboxylesterase
MGLSPVVQHVAVGDRTLAVEVTGAPNGFPVFLMHGTPGSRKGPRPRGIALHRLGIKLISYDRPGFGESGRVQKRSVADAAHDVAAIADHLQAPTFAVVGRSGGGPHALACAAQMPERVTRTAVLVSLAPTDAVDLDWYEGMNNQNQSDYTSADADAQALLANLESWAERMQRDPRDFLDRLHGEATGYDRVLIEDPHFRRQLLATYAEATRQGADGWIDDVLALRRPWGIDLSLVRCPVRLWHGADDEFSPVRHSRWLAAQLRNADLEVQPDAGHFSAMEVMPSMLSWAARTARTFLKPVQTVSTAVVAIRTGPAGRSHDREGLPAAAP